jgi:hypothetical protein
MIFLRCLRLLVFSWILVLLSTGVMAQSRCADVWSIEHTLSNPTVVVQRLLQSIADGEGSLASRDQRAVFSLLTGFSPDYLLHSRRDSGFVHKLLPIKDWSRIIQIVDWQGHIYFRRKRNFKETHFNTFWGRPFNMRPSDPVAMVINQQAGSQKVWINLSLGWDKMSSTEFMNLNAMLSAYDKKLTLHSLSMDNPSQPNKKLLVITGLTTEKQHLELLDLLVSSLQDLYLD